MSSISKPVANNFSGNSHRPTTPNKQVLNASNVKGPHMVLLNHGNPNVYQSPWKSRCRETVVTVAANGILNLPIVGGSDNGDFAYLGYLQQEKIHYVNGRLENGDILLEIQGQKVVGYTQRDVVAWLNHCCRNGNAVILRVTDAGTLTKDLRQYLNTRFLKGSADHDLQNTIRDNLYLRTVPCTTRPKRDGEVDGVDYTFLTLAEFLALERSGNLLESGIYEGNHYGTPKPPRESPLQCPLVRSIANGVPPHPQHHSILPGAHPSSEGKRRRNRSNVEAMASKSMDPDSAHPPRSHTPSLSSLAPSINNSLDANNVKDTNLKRDPGTPPELGPLSSNWEKAFTENGEIYFIDHSSGTSQWLDPRLARVQKKAIEDCADDELPYGWEKIDDPQFGTYYIDHINRQTQYENPVWQAKRVKEEQSQSPYGEGWEKVVDPQHGTYYIDHVNQQTIPNQNKRADEQEHQTKAPMYNGNGIPNSDAFDEMPNMARDLPNFSSNGKLQNSDGAGPPSTTSKPHTQSGLNAYFHCLPCLSDTREECGDSSPSPQLQPTEPPNPAHFTRNPSELRGTFITSMLVKSSRGFGFTIVGGDDEVEEFLQIKSVVPEGPAWQEGKLAQGDILVYVDDICVLGYTHRDVVTMFQNIPVGEEVTLEVCRGYPLPFDPNDPNTEIVTTLAVTADDNNAMDPQRPPPPPPLPLTNFATDLSRQDENNEPLERSSNGAIIVEGSETPDILEFYGRSHDGPVPLEVLTVGIVKGLMGFGFTIADSAHGQKVKKILDRPRCKNLAEGDVLLEINNKDVRGLEHAHVVQFLKDCAQGLEATITVQRGGQSSGKSRAKAMKAAKSLEDNAMPRKEELEKSQERFYNSVFSKSFDGGMPPMGPYRSKTPTADLYGSHREKEIVPNRPKTPLVDTRNRPKTPTSVTANGIVRPKTPGTQDQALDNRTQGGILNNSSPAILDIGGAIHSNNLGTLGPGSLYARDGRYPDSTDNWQSGKLGRGYGERPMMPERGRVASGDSAPTHEDQRIGAPPGNSQLPNWSMEAKQQEENYYGYEHGRGDGEGSAAFSLNNRPFADQDQHFGQPNSSGDPSAMYNNQARNNPYGSTYGVSSVQNTSHYGTSMNNNAPPYNNNLYPDGGGSGNVYEADYGSHYSAPHLRKQGTSFEREQPSPVNHVARKVNNWYVGQQEKERNQSFSPAFPVNHNPEYTETTITLYKQETGFGFRIVGGTEEGSQVSIGHIVPGGAADLDGRLKSGDEITLVDNHSVLHTSHHHVVQLMGLAAHSGRVTLGIRRRLQPRDASRGKSLDGVYPYDVTVVRRENEGFGFVIISSVTRAGSTIGRIIENSPAERCGHLHVGDRILAVNGKDIMNLHHGEIVNFIKDSGFSVTLTIGPPQDDTSSTTSASQRNSNLSVISALAMPVMGECSEVHLRRRNMCSSTPCLPLGYHDSFAASRPSSTYGSNNNGEGGVGGGYYPRKSASHRYSYYTTRNSMGKSLDAWQQEEGALDDEQYYAVELLRGTRGFGFSIRGGREFHNMALFVLRIAEDGPAARDGRLQKGDQIVEINGINTKDMTHADAIDLIKQGGTAVRLLIKRGANKMPPYGSHPSLPIDHRGVGGTNNQSQVISPVIAGSFPTSGSGGYLPANASNTTSHLSPGLHNGPLGQSSPRVLMVPERDPYYSQWEYERGPV